VPLWKKILLRSLGFGAGFALMLCAVVGTWVWYQQRPKPPTPWNKQAIAAEYVSVDTDKDNYLSFNYTLQNNSDEDFRLDSDLGVDLAAKLQKQKEFGQFSQKYLTLEYPVFIPAKSRVRLALHLKQKYSPQPPQIDPATGERIDKPKSPDEREQLAKEVAKYVTATWPNLNGFVLFATIGRFEIDFPSGWEKAEKGAADKN
jgi:hypothetical protein